MKLLSIDCFELEIVGGTGWGGKWGHSVLLSILHCVTKLLRLSVSEFVRMIGIWRGVEEEIYYQLEMMIR